MFEANIEDLDIWINGNPTRTRFQCPERIREKLKQGNRVSVDIIRSKRYLGFIRTIQGNVLIFTDGTKLTIT